MSARILVVDDSSTIRKVVGAILNAHAYEAVLASDGVEALELLNAEDAQKVDLVLLDFVMPRMNGYQFCRELRAHPEHRSLPVVLMSAKGDKIRGQFVQQTGAIDAITKPFDARGLIAVVEGALKKHTEGRGRPVPEAHAMPEDEESSNAENFRPSRSSFSEDPGLRRVQAAQEFGLSLSQVMAPELSKIPELSPETAQAVSLAVQRAITPDNMGALSTLMKMLTLGENTRDALSGERLLERLDRPLAHLEHEPQLVAVEVDDLQERAGRHDADSARTPATRSAASCSSASVTVSGGANRRVVAFTALQISPAPSPNIRRPAKLPAWPSMNGSEPEKRRIPGPNAIQLPISPKQMKIASIRRYCRVRIHCGASGASPPVRSARPNICSANAAPAKQRITPMQPTISPAIAGRRNSSRSSSEPKRARAGVHMSVCTPRAIGTPPQWMVPNSSAATTE